MQTKRWVVSLLTILLLLPMLLLPSHAEQEPEFFYELTVDGQDSVEVHTGDVITVTLYLYRTDKDEPYNMYAMQDEIRYDTDFFELVEDSAMLATGIHSTDISVGGGFREFYMNYVSFAGGDQWQPKMRIGSFQLRVIGTSGVSTITHQDCLVSHRDGMGGYACEANELMVILSTECEVKFETNGGTPIEPAKALYGETLAKPADPVREGMTFVGWYTDIRLTKEWNFDTDTVQGNMKLYAKWEKAEIPTDTEPPTTEPPTTEPPTTEPPTTEPPTTEPPTTEPPTTEPPTTEPPMTEPPETETKPETETEPVTTEPTTTEPDETQPPESSIETETQPPEEGTQPEKDPGHLPEGQVVCRHCGKATYGQLCITCSLKLYFLVLLVIVIVFIFVVALYAWVTKKATKNELNSDDDAQDPYLTQQNIADNNQQDSEDNQDIDPHNS